MYSAIYRDFRPDRFDQIVGQDHIVRILKNQIATGQTGHAYLFCGTRGTGKTTTARILAKALNCEAEERSERPCGECESCRAIKEGVFMDVIEIDAASNNGVDSIRELRESVKYPPVRGRNKVYIIDEVHMLSPGAFNALLKTLEEPPESVVFILATTEPQKLPATILSRCMRLDFRRVSESVIAENMRMICEARGIGAEDSALALIAINADGSVRDSLSILEQCISTGQEYISRGDVAELLGTAGEEALISLTDCIIDGDISQGLLLLDQMIRGGSDVKQLMKEWLSHFRNLLMAKYVNQSENLLNMSAENAGRVKVQSGRIDAELLNRAIGELSRTISEARWAAQPRVLLEVSIVRLGSDPGPEEIPSRSRWRSRGAESRKSASAGGRGAAVRENPQDGRHGAAVRENPQDSRHGAVAQANPPGGSHGAAAQGGAAHDRRGASATAAAAAGQDRTAAETPVVTESSAVVKAAGGIKSAVMAETAAGTDSSAVSEAAAGNIDAGMGNLVFSSDDMTEDMDFIPTAQQIYDAVPAEVARSTRSGEDRQDTSVPGTSAPDALAQGASAGMGNRSGPGAGDAGRRTGESGAGFGGPGNDGGSGGQAPEEGPDASELWKNAVKKAVGEKPMLIRIETKAHPIRIADGVFYVSVDDEYTEKVLMEKGRELVESRLELYYGSRLALRVDRAAPQSVQADAAEKNSGAEDIARQIEEKFHMKVDIE